MSGLLCIVLGYFALGLHMLTCLRVCVNKNVFLTSHLLLIISILQSVRSSSPSESRMDFSPYTA